MSNHRLRAYWALRQGLLERSTLSNAEVLSKAGWQRSVGGANPYLALFARNGCSKAKAEEDTASLFLSEIPCARGCTYVVGYDDFAPALRVGGKDLGLTKVEQLLGITQEEVEILQSEVLFALRDGQLDPNGLKKTLGASVRNLGDEGKNRGQTTTLASALTRLQAKGQIIRRPIGGRLDNQRYAYEKWSEGPDVMALSWEQAVITVAHGFFAWAGPAKPSEFQSFLGVNQSQTKEALAGLDLKDCGDGRLILASQLGEFEAFTLPEKPHYRLIASLDSHVLLRDKASTLVDEAHYDKTIFTDGKTEPAGSLSYFYANVIVDRGTAVGVWEFDPEAGKIVWTTWNRVDEALLGEIANVEDFVKNQLGDARSFSLDSPQSRKPRVEAIRQEALAHN